MSKDDHNDTLMEVQQQLEGHAAAITQINATLQALNTTLNEVRMNQELQYRDPIREDRNNQPHRRGPRRSLEWMMIFMIVDNLLWQNRNSQFPNFVVRMILTLIVNGNLRLNSCFGIINVRMMKR